MKVNLAGYNIEQELIQSLTKGHRTIATPETVSAAYARVSRSTKPVDELRHEARKEISRARKSNQTIVFEMGHHSIAEHAVFNFDVIGLSRLAVEAIEHHRLNAFTEKSQRYVPLSDDFLVPEEIQNSEFLEDFVSMVKTQNRYYHLLYEKLRQYFKDKYPKLKDAPVGLDNAAKEDARYITCLATKTQLGMTVNARNLELMIRRFAASELAEVRTLGQKLYQQAARVAPSLLVFTGPTDYEKNTYPRLREYATSFMVPAFIHRPRNFIAYSASDVSLVDYTQNADNKLLAALLQTCSRASFAECLARVERQTLARKKEIFKLACRDLQAYDAVLREFEHLSVTFELVISASCFAQLKRHRLASVTCQPYNPDVGWTIPVSVAEIKEHKNFKTILARTEETYDRLTAHNPVAAQYILTNSHQRRVLMTLNARELYHIVRLREDMAAQWDIRDIAGRMVEQARHVMPLTLILASGKDNYSNVYQDFFGELPAVTNLELPVARPLPEAARATSRKKVARSTGGFQTRSSRQPARKTKKTTRKKKDG
ncbi:hypothetical protein CH330_06695 [candidate division WOR-3 bacterium JGI_Cruoil_03_51_56]|uniref:Thymidylate synthase (FAD) n=1 Tax=candidate division WOR-3 bacterium JGI_Cruoil_03_51_56 TaxID=1973747 RepID=A0A235BRG7_UNCW3|nr:MAG: hypothetical protein CH330_06695 [candidate division WOR-3 bacterium JGI_Cruoil_03_51_56]